MMTYEEIVCRLLPWHRHHRPAFEHATLTNEFDLPNQRAAWRLKADLRRAAETGEGTTLAGYR